jgi:hypothetical protein
LVNGGKYLLLGSTHDIGHWKLNVRYRPSSTTSGPTASGPMSVIADCLRDDYGIPIQTRHGLKSLSAAVVGSSQLSAACLMFASLENGAVFAVFHKRQRQLAPARSAENRGLPLTWELPNSQPANLHPI